MADTKNLCAQIPIDLHRQVREHQEESGKSLGEYMTWLITTFYQTEVEKQMSNPEPLHSRCRQTCSSNSRFIWIDIMSSRKHSSWTASSGRWRMKQRDRMRYPRM